MQLNKHVIVDTPNLLYYNQHKGKNQFNSNLIAFLGLLSLKIQITVILTPKIEREYPQIFNNLSKIFLSGGNGVIFTGNQDPDEVLLQFADENKTSILTNDKFRQSKYLKFRSRNKVIRYCIRSNLIVPMNKIWKNIFGKISD